MADMSLAAQMGVGAMLGFVTIVVFSFIAPPPDAMQAAAVTLEANKKIEEEKEERDRAKLIKLITKQHRKKAKQKSSDNEEDDEIEEDEEARELRQEEEREADERRKRLLAAGVDMEKIRTLVGELESESAGTSKLAKVFLQLLSLLFVFVVLIMGKLALNNIGVSLSDLFPREMAVLQGNVKAST